MPHVEINEINPGSPEYAKTKAFERRVDERPDLSYEEVVESLLADLPAERLSAAEKAKPERQSVRMAHRALVQPRARSLAHWIQRFEGLTGSVPDADGTQYPVSLESFKGRDPDATVIAIAVVSP